MEHAEQRVLVQKRCIRRVQAWEGVQNGADKKCTAAQQRAQRAGGGAGSVAAGCSSAAAPGAVHERELSRLEACRVCTELAQGCAPTRRFALQGACRGAEVRAKGVQGVRRACTSWGTGCAVVEVALHVCAQLCAEDA